MTLRNEADDQRDVLIYASPRWQLSMRRCASGCDPGTAVKRRGVASPGEPRSGKTTVSVSPFYSLRSINLARRVRAARSAAGSRVYFFIDSISVRLSASAAAAPAFAAASWSHS